MGFDAISVNHLQETAPDGLARRDDQTKLTLAQLESDGRAESPANKSEKQERQWTVAIDLKVHFNLRSDKNHLHMGAEFQADRLRQLAEQTRGKPVTLIVQQAKPENSFYRVKPQLNRFVIENGNVTSLEDPNAELLDRKAWPDGVPQKRHDTQGFAQDTTDLLKLAQELFPSRNLGLVVNAHGTGNTGLYGDTGKVTVEQFKQSLTEGLTQGSKLELLDFMSCDMSQEGMLFALRDTAKNIVASPTPELVHAEQDLNGEDINQWLSKLTERPEMNGREVATEAIKAQENTPDLRYGARAVKTLAHFDTTKYSSFEKAFDDFGNTLAVSVQDRATKAALQSIVPDVTKYSEPWRSDPPGVYFNSSFQSQTRDLRDFAQRIKSAIASGVINDADNRLYTTAKNVIVELNELSPSYFGAKTQRFDYGARTRGLSIFLPNQDSFDIETPAKLSVGFGSAFEFCPDAGYSPERPSPKDAERLLKLVMQHRLAEHPDVKSRVEQLAERVADVGRLFGQSTDSEQMKKTAYLNSVTKICDDAQSLLTVSPFREEYDKALTRLSSKRQSAMSTELGPSTPGWRRFLEQWSADAMPNRDFTPTDTDTDTEDD